MGTAWMSPDERPVGHTLSVAIYALAGATLLAAAAVAPPDNLRGALIFAGVGLLVVSLAYVICAITERLGARRRKAVDRWFRSVVEPHNVKVIEPPVVDWRKEGWL